MSATNKSIPHVRVIKVPASNGTAISISADLASVGYVEITECAPDADTFTGANFAPQGLNFQQADDGFTDTQGLAPGDTWVLGMANGPNRSVAHGSLPFPDGTTVSPTAYMKELLSATTTATYVSVKEWPQR